MTAEKKPTQVQQFTEMVAPPTSEEAETAVLGALIVGPDQFPAVARILKAQDFFLVRHGYIWLAMERLHERNEPLDVLTLATELHDKLAEIGGSAYLTELVNRTPTSVYAEVYARIVQRTASRRRLLKAAEDIKALALDEGQDIKSIADQADAKLHAAVGLVEDTIIPLSEAVKRHFDELEYNMNTPGGAQGISTGLLELDALLGGLRRRRVYVCGARTHMGKTSLALTIMVNAARQGLVPLLVTMEESGSDVTNRMMALDMQIAVDHLGRGILTKQEYSRYVDSAGQIGTLRAFIDAVPSLTPRGLLQHAESYVRTQGVKLIIVDYLQLMSAGPLDADGEYAKLLYISRQLPKIAHRLNVPIWINGQIHREVERRNDKRPMLFDFEGCGKIEQSADVALMLYRDSFYNETATFPEMVEVIVRKNKVNGKLGTANLRFDMESTRFSDWTRPITLGREEPHWTEGKDD